MPKMINLSDNIYLSVLREIVDVLGGWVGVLFSLFIIVVYLRFRVRYVSQLVRIDNSLDAARDHLESGSNIEEPFASGPGHLEDLWSEYLSRRKQTTVIVEGEEVHTLDIGEVFTEGRVLEGYNRNMAVAVAGVLTGLGILGTFIGLIIGMAGLGTGIPQMVNNIGQLISGMGTAFITSIVGITFSLAWLSTDRTQYHAVRDSIASFFYTVRRLYPVEETGHLLHRLLSVGVEHQRIAQDSREHLEEQEALLRSLSFDLADEFSKALNTSLAENLTPTLDGMATTMESLAVQIGDRQTEAVRQLVEIFQEQLTSELGGHFEGLSQALEQTAQWQKSVHEELEELIERLQESSRGQLAVIEQSREASDLFSSSLEQLGQVHERINASAEGWGELSKQLEARFSSLAAGFGDRVEEVTATLTKALETSAARLSETAEVFELRARTASELLESRVDELDRQHTVYREANEAIRSELASQLDGVTEQVNSLTTFWTNFRTDMADLGDQLEESVSTFSSMTGDKLGEIFARFDAEMATVVEHLSGTLVEVRETTGELPASARRLHDALSESVESIASTAEAIHDIAAPLRSLESLPSAISSLSPLDSTIQLVAERIVSAENAITMMTNRITAVDQVLTSVKDGQRVTASGDRGADG